MRKRTSAPLAPRRMVDPTGHFVRKPWGGRKARVRGKQRIATDADTRAAGLNWARLGVLGVTFARGKWTAAPP